jgi:trimeric autotransporter adhesin
VKKSIIIVVILQLQWIVVSAQTHYGSSAGTLGAYHSYFGYFAGNAATSTSYENSFFGSFSGRFTTTGHGNTAMGVSTLNENTTGYWNVAIGSQALRANLTGHMNTAVGRFALWRNEGGYENTALGASALLKHKNGIKNTAVGVRALNESVNGHQNSALGTDALYSNTDGSANTAVGGGALYSNTIGNNNVAVGRSALSLLRGGKDNTAIGTFSLNDDTNGEQNSAVGTGSLSGLSGSTNSAIGYYSGALVKEVCESNYNNFFGANTGSLLCGVSNMTLIGYNTKGTASDQVRIGNTSVTSIGGQVAWSNLSDGRFKKELRSDVAGMDFIRQLKPVSYIVDKDALNKFLGIPDSMRASTSETERNTRQVGFVAQEVEAIMKNSGFVFSGIESPKNENDLYAIRYGEFVVPLVKAMQELMAEVDQLKEQLKQYTEQSSASEKRTTTASLKQNNPNPFSSDTEIRMEIPDGSRQADIIVYNLEGKQLKNIPISGRGDTAIKIGGNNLSAGMYLYTLVIDGEVIDTKRLLLR